MQEFAAFIALIPALNPPSPREEFLAGSREVAPSLLGTIPFGLVVGPLAGNLAILVAARTGSVLAAIVSGMGALWLLQWAIG